MAAARTYPPAARNQCGALDGELDRSRHRMWGLCLYDGALGGDRAGGVTEHDRGARLAGASCDRAGARSRVVLLAPRQSSAPAAVALSPGAPLGCRVQRLDGRSLPPPIG